MHARARHARPGYGITAVLEGGDLLEKAAANISVVRGSLSAARAAAMSSRGRAGIDPAGGQPYSAVAMSLVFHPAHPLVPTLRADVRLFQVRPRRRHGACMFKQPPAVAVLPAAAGHQPRSQTHAPVRRCRRLQVAGQSWYGGGCDLTPAYLFDEDASEFHGYWKGVCDAHDPRLYAEHKDWCDR